MKALVTGATGFIGSHIGEGKFYMVPRRVFFDRLCEGVAPCVESVLKEASTRAGVLHLVLSFEREVLTGRSGVLVSN